LLFLSSVQTHFLGIDRLLLLHHFLCSRFTILEQVLPSYCRCVDIYFILMCLVLGKPIYELPSKPISRISFADLIANFQLPELHLHCLEAVNVIALMLSKIGEGSELLSLATPTSRSHEELPSPPMFGTSISDTALVPPLSPSTSGTSLQTQQVLSPSPTTLRGSLDGGVQQEGGSNAVLSVVRKMTGWTLPIGRTSVSTNVTAAKPLPSEDPQQDPPGEASRGIRGIFARKSPSLSSAQVVGGAPSSPPSSPTVSLSPSASPRHLQPSPPSSPSTSSVVYSPPSLSRSNDEDWDMMQSILSFLLHLTNNMTELQDALVTDGAAHLIENLASILFPHGNLNFPYSGAEEANHPTTEKRYQASGSVFQLLTQVCSCAVKNSIKALAILDTVLEAAPLNTTEVQFIVYQSKILGDTIKSLQGSVSKKAFQENSKLANNTAKFCTLLVDKIQQGLFPSGGRLVFKFFVTTLERLEDLSSDGPSSSGSRFQKSKLFGDLSTIYRALHRLIIYFLSSPTCTINDFGYIINSVLHHQNVVFNSSISTGVNLSNEQEFVYCLCHHLYKFLLHDNRGLREGAMGIWKLLLQKKTELMNEVLIHKPATKGGDTVDLKTGGFDLLLQQDFNAFSFWMTDSVSTIHSVFEELLSKVWLAYQTGENNNKVDQLKRLKARRLKRLQKKVKQDRVDEAVRGKHSSWKTTTKEAVKESDLAKLRIARQEENDRRKFVSILWEKQRVRLTLEKSVWGSDFPNTFDKWKLDSTEGPSRMRKRLERNLRFYIQYPPSSAGGGVNVGSSTAVVRSNSASGLSELERNASFTEKTPTSFDSKPYYEIYGEPQPPRTSDNQTVGARRRTGSHLLHPSLSISLPELSIDSNPSSGGSLSNSLTTLPSVGDLSLRGVQKLKADAEKSLNDFLHRLLPEDEQGALTAGGDESDDDVSDEPSEEEIEASLEESMDDFTPDTVKLQSMLEPGDVVEKVFNCGRVSGLDYRDCIFILGKLNAYTIDEYRVDEVTGELIETCSERILSWEHPSALATVLQTSGPVTTPSPSSQSHSHSHSHVSTTSSYHNHVAHTHHCRKWAYEDIRDIAKRRYLLRPVALELFSTDGRNHLLVFEFLLREEVFRLLNLKLNEFSSPEKSDSKESLPDIQELEQAEGVNKLKLWRKAPLTQRWQKGQLTNFQYLMYLNTLAGRSYNDLTQYPVFPWVLVDYESEELNLQDPKVFRDLSKPMGALESHRAAEFQNRYDGWTPEENNNVPKWHYGTHYSSAAIILYYMIRVEPFTQQFVSLQGGKFDHPDRLFCSILETWKSASGVQNNMADVKELVPEFFYLPQVFENTNNFDFGKKQTGEQLSDVILPPWAKNDPTEFIRRHREALESDYVSEHLNEWIDLVFGCKQQGKAAEEALNVFYYLTYEGAVDLDAISDPTVKEATIAQINNFGQTPTQLFKKPHPKRHLLPTVTNIFTSDFLERSCAKGNNSSSFSSCPLSSSYSLF
jgi:hypothetical protein